MPVALNSNLNNLVNFKFVSQARILVSLAQNRVQYPGPGIIDTAKQREVDPKRRCCVKKIRITPNSISPFIQNNTFAPTWTLNWDSEGDQKSPLVNRAGVKRGSWIFSETDQFSRYLKYFPACADFLKSSAGFFPEGKSFIFLITRSCVALRGLAWPCVALRRLAPPCVALRRLAPPCAALRGGPRKSEKKVKSTRKDKSTRKKVSHSKEKSIIQKKIHSLKRKNSGKVLRRIEKSPPRAFSY